MRNTRVTAICLVAAALTSLVGTLLVSEEGYSTFALVLELLLLGLATLAVTGRWWGLAISGLISGFLGVYTLIGVGGSLDTYGTGQISAAVVFVAWTLGAAVFGLIGAVRQLREIRVARAGTT